MSTAAPSQARARPTPEPRRAPPRDRAWVAVLFTVTAFVGAGLLFTIQPLVARLLLPAYGGSATVWSTCSLFFQTLLIVGYVYSHVTTTRISRRRQAWLHVAVLALPFLVLPVALPGDVVPGADHSPVGWLLRSLVVMIGLPFVVLATTGPLLQRWYSWSAGPRRDDPYFLFAASNVGSFGGLLAYPFLIEPHLSLAQQGVGFTAGFVVFALLTAACGVLAVRPQEAEEAVSGAARTSPRPSARALARWCAYAFVPSCLMLAVTHHLSTDVAPIPLLWVAPLALYLATFVAAFAVRSRTVSSTWPRAAAGLGMAGIAVAPLAAGLPLELTITFNLLLVVVAGYAAHRLLAADRPHPEHLTTYYLAVAVGGALGGVVNGLLAPVVFDRVLEYALVLALLPLLCLATTGPSKARVRSRVHTSLVWILVGTGAVAVTVTAQRVMDSVDAGTGFAVLALSCVTALGWLLTRIALPTSIGLVCAVLAMAAVADAGVVDRERTFYGSYTVRTSALTTSLSHGTTLHGVQLRAESQRKEPTSYYGREAPLGDLMAQLEPTRTAAVGLGVGTVAAYGREGDQITFLEIDQAVADIAEDTRFFTFLSDSDADVEVRIGDGRLLVSEMPTGQLDLVVLDAFSSDAIPVHLLTREAFGVYGEKITGNGALAVHVSNRHFDLVPVVAAAAEHLGWSGAVGTGGAGDQVVASTWVVMSPDGELVDDLLELERWQPLDTDQTVTWTDDYSSVLTVLK